jgi:hypothetical protein
MITRVLQREPAVYQLASIQLTAHVLQHSVAS